jgi:hypothetical protein
MSRRIWDAVASLQLTIVTLALLMALVFLCTIAETRMGVYGAVQTFMRSLVVWWHPASAPLRIPVFPGGVLVGLVLLLNLTAALLKRLDLTWAKSGLWIAHAGLILLVLGEFATGAFQVEHTMSIEEGQTVNYTESSREVELALRDTTDPAHDQVYGIPASLLRTSGALQVPGTPVSLRVKQFLPNAALSMRQAGDPPSQATVGIGTNINVTEQPVVSSDDEANQVSAFVEPFAEGRSLGTWLVSTALGAPQGFTAGGRTYGLALQHRRTYLPYALTLKKFRHDVYPGTDIPRNFSSLIHVSNPSKGEERDALISMNQPLRYEGRTYYQASYGKGDTMTVLQVVQNPGWTLPYISCTLVTLGLLVHFGITLSRFLKQRRAA